MSQSARGSIIVDGVTKRFRRGESHDSLRDLVPSLFRRSASATRLNEFVAVENVSFEVQPGEAVGIVGANGAGKSTMLKLLNGILSPSEGKIFVRGRPTALIEVSAGFHPDLTGRDNIFLQGAILGMRPSDMRSRVDSIIDFAGISSFIDTPVKRYSSGMNARLGFAIAAHLEPDVLLIDEVLAVGDMPFQEKCIKRMHDFKREGVAIVFVSHNMQAISELCDRAILLQSKVMYEGAPAEAVRRYLGGGDAASKARVSPGYQLFGVEVSTSSGHSVECGVVPGSRLRFTVQAAADNPPDDLIVGVFCRRATDGLVVYDGNFPLRAEGVQLGSNCSLNFEIDLAVHLTRGIYGIELFLYEPQSGAHVIVIPDAAIVRVDEQRSWAGIADLDVQVRPAVLSVLA